MTTTQELTLCIVARGEIIETNFPAFAEMVRARLGDFNRSLSSDEDFEQADKDSKAIAAAEADLKAAKQQALADAEQLHALFESIDGLSAELAAARLDLAGQIRKRKEEIKTEIVDEFLAAFDIDPRDARKHFFAGLQGAIKGKRTIESMRSACQIYHATQQRRITEARESIDRFVGKFGADLVMDRRELELKGRESVEAELLRRYEAKRAADEAAKLKAEADAAKAEAAKAQAALVEASRPATAPVATPTPFKADNVVSFAMEATAPTITKEDEWKQATATVVAAFAVIKEHRERLIHPRNINRLMAFRPLVNHAWKEIQKLEVEE